MTAAEKALASRGNWPKIGLRKTARQIGENRQRDSTARSAPNVSPQAGDFVERLIKGSMVFSFPNQQSCKP